MWLLKYNATILRHDSNQLCELNFDNFIDIISNLSFLSIILALNIEYVWNIKISSLTLMEFLSTSDKSFYYRMLKTTEKL